MFEILKHIQAYVGNHGDPQEEHHEAGCGSKLSPVGPQGLRPIVNHACYERLHQAEGTVDSQYLKGAKYNTYLVVIKTTRNKLKTYQ